MAYTPARTTPSDDRTTIHNVLTFTATATATTAAMEDTATRINSSRRIVMVSCAVTMTDTDATAAIVEAMEDLTIVGRSRFSKVSRSVPAPKINDGDVVDCGQRHRFLIGEV